jgi:ribosomal protein S18 acetylase RimI-like enzyme
MSGLLYRRATITDVDGIAALHADSWRRNYRGAYLDSYLDGDVFADRRAVWTERLSAPGANTVTIVAEEDGAVVGFAHTVLDEHVEMGALLDNLHVVHDRKGSGIGTRLVTETATAVLRAKPGSGLYLKVLEQNTSAQAFYDARGGRCVGRELAGPFPGGGRAFALLYAWPDPSALIAPRPR